MSGLMARSGFSTSVRTCTVRVSGFTVELMKMILPVTRRPGSAGKLDAHFLAHLDEISLLLRHLALDPHVFQIGDGIERICGLHHLALIDPTLDDGA